LKINFLIPRHHRSASTAQGFIFLTGGIECLPEGSQNKILRDTYILDIQNRTLAPVAKMLLGRIEHSLVILNDELYAIGGFTEHQEFTTSCEKYNPQTNAWTQLPSLRLPCHSACTCTFNNRYIYRIGGKLNRDQLNEHIDRLDTLTSPLRWEEIHIKTTSISPQARSFFRILSNSACVQVSHDSILVFGGTYEDYATKSNGSYIIKLKKDNIFQEGPEGHEIVAVNEHQLPYAEGFWSQQAIIYNRKIFVLQNVSEELHPTNVVLYQKRILMFDDNAFTVIN